MMDYNNAFADPDFCKAYDSVAKRYNALMDSLTQHGVNRKKAVKLANDFKNAVRELRDEEINIYIRNRRKKVG